MLYEIVYFLIVKITLWTEFVAKSINIVGMKVYWGKWNFFTSSVYLSNVSYRLGYVRNPRSLMEGTETLCRDDIGDLPGSPEHLWLRENANEIG